MGARRDPPVSAFLPLTTVVFEILVSLAGEDRHGYSILTDIRSRTGESLRPGSLYRALSRLHAEGLIEELDDRPDPDADDERRRYYRLTSLGRQVARAEAARLDAQIARAKAVLAARRR